MRILISTSTFPHELDAGLPRFVNDLAEALSELMEVTVLAPDSPGAAKTEQIAKVDVRRFTYFRPRRLQRLALGQGMRDNLRASWLARVQVPAYLAKQAFETRRLIRRGGFDLVFAHWIVPQGLTAAWAVGRTRRVPLVLHVHGGDAYLLKEIPQGRAIARYIVSRSDAVFSSGSGIRDSLDEVLGSSSEAVIQPMGVHAAAFKRPVIEDAGPDEEVVISTRFPNGFVLFVGRMIEIKGAKYLIRAMPEVLRHRPGSGLVLIGDGPARQSIEAEVDRLDVGNSVAFLGRRPHSEVVRYLHRCRAAVVPSIVDDGGRTEGMPTTVIEAMAAGCPVVGTSVGGIPDIVRHGENGWLCRDRDPEDLAEKILTALDDTSDSNVLEAARVTANDHDWRKVAERYADCFADLVARRSGVPTG
jgi:glycosyltransferase involved in cell wall biosynthesis